MSSMKKKAYLEPAIVGVMTNGDDGMQHSGIRLVCRGERPFSDERVEPLMEALSRWLAPHIESFAAAYNDQVYIDYKVPPATVPETADALVDFYYVGLLTFEHFVGGFELETTHRDADLLGVQSEGVFWRTAWSDVSRDRIQQVIATLFGLYPQLRHLFGTLEIIDDEVLTAITLPFANIRTPMLKSLARRMPKLSALTRLDNPRQAPPDEEDDEPDFDDDTPDEGID